MFAPVEKELFQECQVVGVLPEAIQGEFARNGPNPRFPPTGGYHWFDGDGMVSNELKRLSSSLMHLPLVQTYSEEIRG